jgi:hypothetical protein
VVADAELAREEVIHRQLLRGVVRHDDAGVAGEAGRARLHVIRDEADVVSLQLLVDAPARVAGVLRLRHRRPCRGVDEEALAAVVVFHRQCRPLHILAAVLDREETEHVVERPVLHHQDNDVLDLLQVFVGRCHRHPRLLAAARVPDSASSSALWRRTFAQRSLKPARNPIVA